VGHSDLPLARDLSLPLQLDASPRSLLYHMLPYQAVGNGVRGSIGVLRLPVRKSGEPSLRMTAGRVGALADG